MQWHLGSTPTVTQHPVPNANPVASLAVYTNGWQVRYCVFQYTVMNLNDSKKTKDKKGNYFVEIL